MHFPLSRIGFGERPVVRACEGINIEIEKGSFFGLVGESGSGKTTLGRAMLKAAPISHGEVLFTDGEVEYSLGNIEKEELKDYRKRAQLIFQDPYAALSPRMTVRDIIAEPMLALERWQFARRQLTVLSVPLHRISRPCLLLLLLCIATRPVAVSMLRSASAFPRTCNRNRSLMHRLGSR